MSVVSSFCVPPQFDLPYYIHSGFVAHVLALTEGKNWAGKVVTRLWLARMKLDTLNRTVGLNFSDWPGIRTHLNMPSHNLPISFLLPSQFSLLNIYS